MKNRDVYNSIKTLNVLESREKILEFMKQTMNLNDEKASKLTEKFFKTYKKKMAICNRSHEKFAKKFDAWLEDQLITGKFN